MSRYPWPDFSSTVPLNLPDEDGWILVVEATEETPHSIRVKVDQLADGRPIITGLMLDPAHDAERDYEGHLRDQEVSRAMLAGFPTRSVLTAATALGIVAAEGNLVRGGRKLKAALARASTDDGLDEVARLGTERDRRIVKAVRAYDRAVESGDPAPRQEAARKLGYSVRTLDEYLSDARKRGWLVAYEGPQAKHGVTSDADAPTGGGQKPAPRKRKGSK